MYSALNFATFRSKPGRALKVPADLRPDVELSLQGHVRRESLLRAFPGLNFPTGQRRRNPRNWM
jgi:hypothetical protein